MRIYNIKKKKKKYEVKVMGITEVEPTEVKVIKGQTMENKCEKTTKLRKKK